MAIFRTGGGTVKTTVRFNGKLLLRKSRRVMLEALKMVAKETITRAKRSMRNVGHSVKIAGKVKDWESSSKAGKPPFSHTGDLKESLGFKITERGNVLVGSLGGLKYAGVLEGLPTNKSPVRIPVSEKMRGFFLWNWGIRLKKSTTHILIQRRPYIWPAFLSAIKSYPRIVAEIRSRRLFEKG